MIQVNQLSLNWINDVLVWTLQIFVYHHGEVIQGAPAEVVVKVDAASVKLLDPITVCAARGSTPVKISAEYLQVSAEKRLTYF